MDEAGLDHADQPLDALTMPLQAENRQYEKSVLRIGTCCGIVYLLQQIPFLIRREGNAGASGSAENAHKQTGNPRETPDFSRRCDHI